MGWRGHKLFYLNDKGVSDKNSGNCRIVKNKDTYSLNIKTILMTHAFMVLSMGII
jgi:hypothetical protein